MENAAGVILRRAIEADQAERVAEALSSYKEGIAILLDVLKQADNVTKKKALRVRIDEYMQRAEVLKAKLDAKQAEGRYHEQLQIPAGAQGFGYERVFQPFIDDKLAHVEVEDPYVRASHQVLNFVRFCEVLVKLAKSLQTIHLKTGRHESQEARATQARALSGLATDLAERRNVQLSFEFSDVMHDREIRFSTGWVVKIGRGLDYFRPPVSKYSIGAFDLSLRPCHETTVDIFHAKNVKVTHSAQ